MSASAAKDSPLVEAPRLTLDQAEKAVTSVIDDGLGRASNLLPGHGFFDITGGVTQDMAFGRADVGVKIADNAELFGFGQVQKDFASPDIEFSAGGGVKISF